MTEEEPLFVAGKAKWLLENARKLTPEQRALLLAMADLDVQSGRQLTAEERAALDELASQSDGYNPDEIEQAMRQMVKAQTQRKVVEWPKGLSRKVRAKK